MTTVAEPETREGEHENGRSAFGWALLVLPQLILAGSMLLMLALHPNAVKSGVMSARAVLVNTALLGGWLLLSFVIVPRVVRSPAARSAILTALAIGAITVLVVPTLRDTKVVEKFPRVAALRDEPAPTPAPTATPQPVRVSTGRLTGIDHDASGTASVYRQPDGSVVVALEAIDIEPGPDYYVFVVPGRDRRSPADGIELAKLKGNQGTQYYEVPGRRDVGEGWTVLIWCRAFGVPIAGATQSA